MVLMSCEAQKILLIFTRNVAGVSSVAAASTNNLWDVEDQMLLDFGREYNTASA